MLKHDFFKTIDNEEKAYILGFLYADGYFTTKKNCITINLSVKDSGHLKDMSRILCGEDKTEFYKLKKKPVIHGREINSGEFIKLHLHSKEMANDLKNTGNESPKTFNLKYPVNLPDNLINHFVRGYFDGDGTICLKNNSRDNVKRCSFSFISTIEFCETIKQIISNVLDIKSYIYPKGQVFSLNVTGNLQCEKIFDWLYKDCTIKLERKYQKYLLFKEHLIKCKEYYSKSSSKYKNICYDKSRNKWMATIRLNKKTINLGRYNTEEDAYHAQQKYLTIQGAI